MMKKDKKNGLPDFKFTPAPPQIKKESIGEQFMQWAETYWNLEELVTNDNYDRLLTENFSYEHMRKAFVKKIDSLNEYNDQTDKWETLRDAGLDTKLEKW